MGIYIYKVIGKTVNLANGELANISLYAYKDGWDARSKHHVRSGTARCEDEAAAGNRTGWIVQGYLNDDGTIEINPVAHKAAWGPRGSYINDFTIAEGDSESAVILSPRQKKIRFFPAPKKSESA